MTTALECISPIDGSCYAARAPASDREVEQSLARAQAATRDWQRGPLAERADLCRELVRHFCTQPEEIATELAWQMGRPVRFGPGEVNGFQERALSMIGQADEALADRYCAEKPGFRRFIRREPLGIVLTIAPWNYPYLTAVNSIVPALMAGNVVLLKHSHQTPLCAERIIAAGTAAGLPEGVLQYLHLDRAQTAGVIGDPRIAGVCFTGSVAGGAAVETAAAGRFIPVGLELGGKDPAYVRPDADLVASAAGVAEGAFFNAGQSCCGIERVYVHRDCFSDFLEALVTESAPWRPGHPLSPDTLLGPMVRTTAADFVRRQIADAVQGGARALLAPTAASEGGAYLAPQVLVDVNHGMSVMREESFGPVIGVMAVSGDEEAIQRMNDSSFGLTASIWSQDVEAALAIGAQLQTGTVFLNRCDYLDPELAWTGVKDSGRGCSLSVLGYGQLTQPKSFHLRLPD